MSEGRAAATETRSAPTADGAREEATDRKTVALCLLAAPGLAHDLAKNLARRLPRLLSKRFPEVEWRVIAKEEPLAAAQLGDMDLVQVSRRRMLDAGWDLVICLTDVPVLIERRPVAAHASMTHGVGLISVPALGAVALETRVEHTVLRLIERLLGEKLDDGGRRRRNRRRQRMRERLDELADPVRTASVQQDERTVRFVSAVVRGNLRLLLGMVRANRPWRLVVGLSRALAAALGTAAFGIASPGIWRIADGLTWPRAVVLAVAAVIITCISLIVAHHLWERSPGGKTHEKVVLFNLATAITVVIGVLTLFLMLFAINTATTFALIVPRVLESQLGHEVGSSDYLRLAMLVTTLATIGGALGSALESDRAVRAAAYGYRPDEDE